MFTLGLISLIAAFILFLLILGNFCYIVLKSEGESIIFAIIITALLLVTDVWMVVIGIAMIARK